MFMLDLEYGVHVWNIWDGDDRYNRSIQCTPYSVLKPAPSPSQSPSA